MKIYVNFIENWNSNLNPTTVANFVFVVFFVSTLLPGLVPAYMRVRVLCGGGQQRKEILLFSL